MNPNDPYTFSVKLHDGKREYILKSPSDLTQVVMETTAPALDLYFDNVYQGTWYTKELANENN